MKERTILIGGAPTAGKSFVAAQLSRELGIPWISTDQIREIMRATVPPAEYPALFKHQGMSGEEFLTTYAAEEIVQSEIDQAEETWRGIVTLVKEPYPWKSLIVEGVAVLPHLVVQDFKNNEKVRAVFLVDADADRIKDVVFTRGLWDDAKTYSDSVKE